MPLLLLSNHLRPSKDHAKERRNKGVAPILSYPVLAPKMDKAGCLIKVEGPFLLAPTSDFLHNFYVENKSRAFDSIKSI